MSSTSSFPTTSPTHLGTPEEVWIKLKQIVVAQLGISPESVQPGARWYEDLGAG